MYLSDTSFYINVNVLILELRLHCNIPLHFALFYKQKNFIRGNGAPLLYRLIHAAAPSNEKTITVHSITVPAKVQLHLGIFTRREMDVSEAEGFRVADKGHHVRSFSQMRL